jgi:hypothetical protein
MFAVPDERDVHEQLECKSKGTEDHGGIWLYTKKTVGWSSRSLHSTISPIFIFHNLETQWARDAVHGARIWKKS